MDPPYIFTQQTGILPQVGLFILLIFTQLLSSTLLHYLQDLHLHSIKYLIIYNINQGSNIYPNHRENS